MIRLKKGVRINGLKPELLLGIMIVKSVFDKYGFDCVLTSVVDGKHSRGSFHYSGNGADFRTRHLSLDEQADIHTECVKALGADFDFIRETNHFHLESQPKDPL